MKKCFWLISFVLVAAVYPAHADDKIVLQLKWVDQAQFAGYYAALENGYYADEDLEVEIRAGGPDIEPAQVISAGAADVVIEWMAAALHAREKGIPLINIAQPFKYSGAGITCLRSANIQTLDDLRGKRIGHWPGPDQLQVQSLLDKLGIPVAGDATAGGPKAENSARLLAYGDVQYGLKTGRVDCISTLSYSDSVLLADAGFHKNELIGFDYNNLGIATLQDGLWVLEGRLLNDAKFSDAMVRFVRASMRGWRWAEDNQEDAVQIVLQAMGGRGDKHEEHQRFMMREIAKLTAGSNGALDIADYERTVQVLLDGGTLTETPQGAWISDITDRAHIYEAGRFARLVAELQEWGQNFILDLLNPENSASHLYNILLVAAMMMRNVVLLRAIFLVSISVAICNDLFWRQDAANLFWSLLLLAVNVVHLLYSTVLSMFVKLSTEEDEFISKQFPLLDKINARRLLKKGEFGVAGKEFLVIRAGERVNHIYYVLSGGSVSRIFGEQSAPVIIGSISVMDMDLGYSDVELREGSRYWRIEAGIARALVKKSSPIANALYETFTHNMKTILMGRK